MGMNEGLMQEFSAARGKAADTLLDITTPKLERKKKVTIKSKPKANKQSSVKRGYSKYNKKKDLFSI